MRKLDILSKNKQKGGWQLWVQQLCQDTPWDTVEGISKIRKLIWKGLSNFCETFISAKIKKVGPLFYDLLMSHTLTTAACIIKPYSWNSHMTYESNYLNNWAFRISGWATPLTTGKEMDSYHFQQSFKRTSLIEVVSIASRNSWVLPPSINKSSPVSLFPCGLSKILSSALHVTPAAAVSLSPASTFLLSQYSLMLAGLEGLFI